MKAKFIRKLSENTSLFQCDPPMKFLKPSENDGINIPREVVKSGLVVAYSVELAEGLHRAVLHNAHLLAGSEGIAYGASGNRIFDADMNHEQALNAAGYTVSFDD